MDVLRIHNERLASEEWCVATRSGVEAKSEVRNAGPRGGCCEIRIGDGGGSRGGSLTWACAVSMRRRASGRKRARRESTICLAAAPAPMSGGALGGVGGSGGGYPPAAAERWWEERGVAIAPPGGASCSSSVRSESDTGLDSSRVGCRACPSVSASLRWLAACWPNYEMQCDGQASPFTCIPQRAERRSESASERASGAVRIF
jgi:hypothetical protein